jgi:hypothetical protein
MPRQSRNSLRIARRSAEAKRVGTVQWFAKYRPARVRGWIRKAMKRMAEQTVKGQVYTQRRLGKVKVR